MKSSKQKHHTKHKTKKICAPETEDSFTCFTKKSLLNIIKYWNKYYKDNTILFNNNNTKKELWSKLNKKLQNTCDNEYCWTNQQFLKSNSVDLKKKAF